MTTRARIAEDFFDETFTQPEPPKAKEAAPTPKVETAKPEPKPKPKPTPAKQTKAAAPEPTPSESKVRTTLYIREELHEKARWAILNLEKAPRSISQLMEHALERELARLSKTSGKEIERHRMGLPGGRPRATT